MVTSERTVHWCSVVDVVRCSHSRCDCRDRLSTTMTVFARGMPLSARRPSLQGEGRNGILSEGARVRGCEGGARVRGCTGAPHDVVAAKPLPRPCAEYVTRRSVTPADLSHPQICHTRVLPWSRGAGRLRATRSTRSSRWGRRTSTTAPPSRRCTVSSLASRPSSPRPAPPSRRQRSGRPRAPRPRRPGSPRVVTCRARWPGAGSAWGGRCASCPCAPRPGGRARSGPSTPGPSPRPGGTAPRPPWPATRRCSWPRPMS